MDIKEIMQIIEAVKENNLTSFELKEGDTCISLKREVPGSTVYVTGAADQPAVQLAQQGMLAAASVPAAAEPTQAAVPTGNASEKVITSPLVGVFYNAPSPDAAPYIQVGDTVKKGQVIGIVEAMKLMNEIESEYDGVVTEILIGNEEVVEYGQPLVRVK